MKKLIFALFFALGLNAGELNVAAAANVTYPIEDIKAEFAKLHPDIKLNVSLGASGNFAAQIRNGAPFDVFLAANMKYADDLFKEGFAVEAAKIYANGKLALFSARDFDLSKGLEILKDDKVKTIAIANPKTAPYGVASMQAFEKTGILNDIKSKIIEAKSIGDALNQAINASDVGLVAASSMFSKKTAEYKEGKNFVLVDKSLYDPISQGIVILKKAEKNADAKAFYDFILSDKCKEIFRKYGYEI